MIDVLGQDVSAADQRLPVRREGEGEDRTPRRISVRIGSPVLGVPELDRFPAARAQDLAVGGEGQGTRLFPAAHVRPRRLARLHIEDPDLIDPVRRFGSELARTPRRRAVSIRCEGDRVEHEGAGGLGASTRSGPESSA